MKMGKSFIFVVEAAMAQAEGTDDAAKHRSSTPISTYGDKPKIVKLAADGEEYYIGSEVSNE